MSYSRLEHDSDLHEAFRGAIYEVYGESGPIALMLDQPLPEPVAAQGGAFLTAHNPLSQRQSAELNAAAQARLIQHVQDARLSFSLGEGRAPEGAGGRSRCGSQEFPNKPPSILPKRFHKPPTSSRSRIVSLPTRTVPSQDSGVTCVRIRRKVNLHQ